MATASLTLYAIEHEHAAWADTLELAETEAERAEVSKRVEEYLGQAMDKRDRFAEFLRHLEHLEVATKSEEERLSKRRKSLQGIRERLEEYAVRTLESIGVKKLDGHTATLMLRKNPDSVDIVDEALIPAEFKKQPPPPPPVVDKMAVKKALQQGEMVPGADLRFGKNRLEVR